MDQALKEQAPKNGACMDETRGRTGDGGSEVGMVVMQHAGGGGAGGCASQWWRWCWRRLMRR